MNEIKALEESADNLMSKPSFDRCLDAIDTYIKAQDLLVSYATDNNALSAYGELKTECLDYKVWHGNLIKKINDAQALVMNPKVAKK